MLNKLSENTLVFGNMSISCCVFSVFLLSTLSSPLFLFLCLVMVSFTHNFNFYMRKHLKILLQIIRSCTCTMHNAPLALTVFLLLYVCASKKKAFISAFNLFTSFGSLANMYAFWVHVCESVSMPLSVLSFGSFVSNRFH